MSIRRADVIVVGAGSAGAVLAARLSEDAGRRVLLLEAGPATWPDDREPEVDGSSFVRAMSLDDRRWPDLVATRAAGQAPRPYVRGRGLGGSSAVNAMVALPGEPSDYDGWAAIEGLGHWSWRDVEPWFARTALTLRRAAIGEWGPVNRALAAALPEAAAGVDLTRDDAGRRVSTDVAYLAPARHRPNLEVLGGRLVDRVLLDGRRAVGVRLAGGEEIEAGTVVVSAGAIHSPAILLRSGLDVDGIGTGLQDHPSFPVALALAEPADLDGLPIATVWRGSSGTDPETRHDLQVLPMDHVDVSMPGLGMLMAAAMRARSRGSVTLAPGDGHDDPLVDPVVDFAMLSDERDAAVLDAAIDALERCLDHPAVRAVGEVLPYDRSAAVVRAAIGDYVHATSTCAMGTVVDGWCRVRGYDGLVVCDASVMPSVPRANTHLPTVMIAERVADHLRRTVRP